VPSRSFPPLLLVQMRRSLPQPCSGSEGCFFQFLTIGDLLFRLHVIPKKPLSSEGFCKFEGWSYPPVGRHRGPVTIPVAPKRGFFIFSRRTRVMFTALCPFFLPWTSFPLWRPQMLCSRASCRSRGRSEVRIFGLARVGRGI